MKKEQISDALNMLNDDIIEETNNVRTMRSRSASGLNGVLQRLVCVLWLLDL